MFREAGNIFLYGYPYQIQVNSKILMNEFVAHTGNLAPGHDGLLISDVVRQLLSGLTDNFESPQDGVLDLF